MEPSGKLIWKDKLMQMLPLEFILFIFSWKYDCSTKEIPNPTPCPFHRISLWLASPNARGISLYHWWTQGRGGAGPGLTWLTSAVGHFACVLAACSLLNPAHSPNGSVWAWLVAVWGWVRTFLSALLALGRQFFCLPRVWFPYFLSINLATCLAGECTKELTWVFGVHLEVS